MNGAQAVDSPACAIQLNTSAIEYVCYSLNLHRTGHYIDHRRLVSKWHVVGKTTNTTVE